MRDLAVSEIADSHLLSGDGVSIDLLNSLGGSILSLEVDVSESAGLSRDGVDGDLEEGNACVQFRSLRECRNEEMHTLQERMFPNLEKVSYSCLLSMLRARFLMNTLLRVFLRAAGSRWLHMIRQGLSLMTW